MVAKKKLVVQVNEDLSKMSVVELKAMCKDLGLTGCSTAKKADLIRMIMGAQRADEKEFTVGGDEDSEEKPVKVAKVAKKTKSPVKKPAKRAKSPLKKKVPAKKAKAPAGDYSTMLLSELKKECKSRGMSVTECNLKKADLIALLQESDAGKKAKSPVKKAKVAVKKEAKSPVKKPAKKVAAKKSPVKKAARCDDKEDPLQCKEGSLCSATSGKCLKDTVGNRKGKAELRVDGRIIIGSAETIANLQKILGGEIVSAKKAKSPVKKAKTSVKKEKSPVRSKSPVKKSPIKKKVSVSPKKVSPKKDKSPSPVKGKSPKKVKTSVKKVPSPAKKAKTPGSAQKAVSPKDVKGIEKRLEELLAEDMQDEGEISRLQAKLKALKGKKISSPASAKKAGKVEMKKQEIYDTFKKCLESLKA